MESNWTYSEILILLAASKSRNNNRFCRQINALRGEEIITCSPRSSYSIRDLSGPTSIDETMPFSTDCLIFSHLDKRCVSCKNLILMDHQKKKAGKPSTKYPPEISGKTQN